jgi:hypothetical protein
MKRLYKVFILLLLALNIPLIVNGQVLVELTIENQSISGSDFLFDIYLHTLPGTSGNLYLGNADFVLFYNNSNFNSPTLTKEGSAPGFCTFAPIEGEGLNTLFLQLNYFNNTSPSIEDSNNTLIINLNGPTPGDQSAFQTSVAQIDLTPITHCLGRFRLSGISNPDGSAGLLWKTSGSGVNTQVFTLGQVEPWVSEPAIITATNPPDITLPFLGLELITSKLNNSSSLLNWNIQNGLKIKEFEIYRSTPGSGWTYVSTVKNEGLIRNTSFDYIDENVYKGGDNVYFYYKLKIFDLDGRSFYSDIEMVTFEQNKIEKELVLYPNPTSGELNFTLDKLDQNEAILLEIYDIEGKLIYRDNRIYSGVKNRVYDVDALNLKSGVYQLIVEDKLKNRYYKKFVYQK